MWESAVGVQESAAEAREYATAAEVAVVVAAAE